MHSKLLKLFESNSNKSFSLMDLKRLLSVNENQISKLKKIIFGLTKSGYIKQTAGKKYIYKGNSNYFEGVLSLTQKGYGFVIVGGEQDDIFIGRRQLGGAINKDKVKVKLEGRQGVRGSRGRITKVLERNTQRFLGVCYFKRNQAWLSLTPVTPERGIIVTGLKNSKNMADKLISAKVINWGTAVSPICAEFEELIGSAGDPNNDIKLILRKFDYDISFPASVQNLANSFSQADITSEIKNRLDIRDWNIITIDPADARDFDDALSFEKKNGGGYKLGVHIADVAHFVQPGSELDREAINRATSVYFSEGVVNMLPEKLSADLCSLKPHVDRLAVSCIMELDNNYEVTKFKILPTVINSKQRFTYEQVQDILDGRKVNDREKSLIQLNKFCRALFNRRSVEGSIDFDIPEPIFSIGPEGIPHEIKPSERLDSHRLVEECMLLANRVVGKNIPQRLPKNYPFVFRIHAKPKQENLEQFKNLMVRLKLGNQLPKGEFTPGDFNRILGFVENSPFRDLIRNVVLRTMSKAIYSKQNLGHFGLAFKHYTHFTSPIRRYPDLMVHRMIKMIHSKQFNKLKSWETYLNKAIENSNTAEIEAVTAEREYIKMKQLRWLSRQVGKSFKGVISGVVNFGLFVALEETLAEGLVSIDSMTGDNFIFDDENYCLRGRQHQLEYRLGDRVQVTVITVLFDKQRANFKLNEN
ncbi:MAG: ribonuclease R [Candidatus Neomarinimicrobiota bacterium]